MDSKIISKLRQALGLSKKYTDEKVAETKEYVDQKFAALPVSTEIPPIPVEDIAAQVVAMLPKPKKLKAKKKNLTINTVSPEDVMAMISSSLRDINTEYQKTGDTIIINEAPQRVIEHIKEVLKEKGGEVDYNLIFIELEKQVGRMRETMAVGSSNSIRGLIDADLTGVPQNERGVYLLGQGGTGSGDVVGPASATDNAIPRYNGTTGKIIQDSQVILDDNGNVNNVNGIQFDTTPVATAPAAGQLKYNVDEDTLDLGMSNGDVTQQIGQEVFIRVKNQTGATLVNGKPVMFAGAVGVSGRLKAQYAIADGSIPAEYIMGVLTQDIADAGDGFVTYFGKVRGIDTTGTLYGEVWADGDLIYVSTTTAGAFTKVKPNAPYPPILVAAVVTAHAINGVLFVRPTWGQKLQDLTDVNGTPLTVTGQIPVWDATNEYFDFTANINDFALASDLSDHIAAADPHPQYQKESEKGSANGYAELDGTGKVPSAQLPSFVDDVLEYANFAALPVTGESGKIYVTLDNNLTYRWSGSVYVEISASLALGETSTTAYRGDRGKTAYDHSQINNANPHNTVASQVPNTPAGNIAATDVQAAINELDSEKASVSHTHSGLAPAGGGLGQVLKKNSATDYDYSWQADNTGGGGGASVTEVEIDFGAITAPNTSWVITDAAIAPSNAILVFPSPNPATGRKGNDWEVDSAVFTGIAGTGNFTLYAIPTTKMVGKRKVYYQVI